MKNAVHNRTYKQLRILWYLHVCVSQEFFIFNRKYKVPNFATDEKRRNVDSNIVRNRKNQILLLLIFAFFSCKKIEISAEKIANKTIEKVFPEKTPKKFLIKYLVKDFENDNSIKEIEGIQVEDLFYKEYFVYTGNRKRVIDGVNKILSENENKSNCVLTTKEDLYRNIRATEEKNKFTNFFWKFEQLNKYEVYSCIKGLNKHYIIFDTKSDTVYHRVEEIRE
jgi:hypothetical protein